MNNNVTIGITKIRDPFNKLTTPYGVGNDVWLKPFDNWFDKLNLEQLFCPDAFPDIKRRKFVYTYYSEKDDELESLEMLTITSLSLWLSNPIDVGFDHVVKAKYNDNWKQRENYTVTPIINLYNIDNQFLTNSDLLKSKKINEIIYNIVMDRDIKKINSLRIALWSLFKALTTDLHSIPIRYIILWITIEALFGPKNGKQIKEKISMRLSRLLGNEEENETQDIYEKTRNAYSWRSKIVHGSEIGSNSFGGEEFKAYYKFCEESIRKTINKILNDVELVRVFCGEDREKYLDDLGKSNS